MDVDFSYVGFWDLRRALPTDINGRVFIAGDAAHSHHYGGYGINTAEDARNLAWKIAACGQYGAHFSTAMARNESGSLDA